MSRLFKDIPHWIHVFTGMMNYRWWAFKKKVICLKQDVKDLKKYSG
jgi:hypothetical protein